MVVETVSNQSVREMIKENVVNVTVQSRKSNHTLRVLVVIEHLANGR